MDEYTVRQKFAQKFKSPIFIILAILIIIPFINSIKETIDAADGGQALQIFDWLNTTFFDNELDSVLDVVHGSLNLVTALKILPAAFIIVGLILLVISGFINNGSQKILGTCGFWGLIGSQLFQIITTLISWIVYISIAVSIKKLLPMISTGFIVAVVLILISIDLFAFIYHLGLMKMFVRSNYSFVTDENHYGTSGFITFWLIFSIIVDFINFLKSLSGEFLGILGALSSLVSLILFLVVIKQLKASLGPNVDEEKINLIKSIKLLISSYKGQYEQHSYNNPPRVSKTVKKEDNIKPQSKTPTVVQQKRKKNNINSYIAAVTNNREFNFSYDELTVEQLKLFSSDFDVLDSRYETIGLQNYQDSSMKNVLIEAIAIIQDNISKRKILRIKAINKTPISIKSISFNINTMGHINNCLGVINDFTYNFDPVENGEVCLTEYGVILPDDVSICEIKINRITFSDGLFLNDDSSSLSISTKEKLDFDKDLYMEIFN